MQIDFLGLQAFLAIAQNGGFAQAAVELSITQTAVSHRLRKLEESLGQRLIARTTRSITLTDAGRELLPRARAAVTELSASFAALRARGAAWQPWLAVACLPTLAMHRLAPAVERFVAGHPGVDVRIYDVSIGEIAELVASGTVEFGLTVDLEPRGPLQIEPIGAEEFVVVCPPGHAFAARESVRWSDLQGETLVRIGLPVGNGPTIDEVVYSLGLQMTWRYEVQRTALALELVAAGLGSSIVPRLSLGDRPALCARPLVDPVTTRQIQLVRRPEAALSRYASTFLEIVRSQLHAALSAPLPSQP